jgi:hypothetical protein
MASTNGKRKFKAGDWVRLGPDQTSIKAQVLGDADRISAFGDNVLWLLIEPIEPGEERTIEKSESRVFPID